MRVIDELYRASQLPTMCEQEDDGVVAHGRAAPKHRAVRTGMPKRATRCHRSTLPAKRRVTGLPAETPSRAAADAWLMASSMKPELPK